MEEGKEEGLPKRRAYPGGGQGGELTQEEGMDEGLLRRRVRRRAYPGRGYG